MENLKELENQVDSLREQLNKLKNLTSIVLIICLLFVVFNILSYIENRHHLLRDLFLSSYHKDSISVTLEEFNEIELGMTYEECVAIIGFGGENITNSHIDGHIMMGYMWENENYLRQMTALFKNNKLVEKRQIGLE